MKDGGVERGMKAVLTEAERVARFGFTATELDRRKQTILRARERALAEKDNVLAATRADEYVRNFLVGETLPSLDDEYALVARFVPEITLDEINRMAKEWFPESQSHGPRQRAREGGRARARRSRARRDPECRRRVEDATETSLTAYVDTAASAVLLETVPEPGPVVKTTAKEAIGITEWELANGVKVVLKPTTFKQDEILFRAVSPGGHLARERRRLHPGQHRDAGGHRRRPRETEQRGPAQGADREDRHAPIRSSASSKRACRAARRRRTWRRCSS